MGKSQFDNLSNRRLQFCPKSPAPFHGSRTATPGRYLPQKPQNASILGRVARKVAIFFKAFGTKSKGVDFPESVDRSGSRRGYGGQNSGNEVDVSYFGLSAGTGSKSGGSSYTKQNDSFGSSSSVSGHVGSLQFSLQDILKATNNFSKENLIGEGGFSTVYKGRLKDGSMVAVKRAKSAVVPKRSGEEFKNEILALSKIEHMNLMRLYGFIEEKGEMLIVVEYASNGNLLEHLDAIRHSGPSHILNWLVGTRGYGIELDQRIDIAIDVAHAIAYLHNYNDPPIVHRDIKSSNILITKKLRAKVADFGFARVLPDDELATHISTQIKGTAGYLDPEYLKTNQLTEKSDVYSFGVLLVELVTGRRPLEPKRGIKERLTTKWAMQALKDDAPVIAMDPRLRRNPASIKAAEKILKLAEKCLATLRPSRPAMRECVEELWMIRKDYREQANLYSISSRRSADFVQVDGRTNRPMSSDIDNGEKVMFASA